MMYFLCSSSASALYINALKIRIYKMLINLNVLVNELRQLPFCSYDFSKAKTKSIHAFHEGNTPQYMNSTVTYFNGCIYWKLTSFCLVSQFSSNYLVYTYKMTGPHYFICSTNPSRKEHKVFMTLIFFYIRFLKTNL